MALNLTFSEGIAVAALVLTILAILFVLPRLLVAFGFFPDSAFARRVCPSNDDILLVLREIRGDVEALRRNSEFHLGWAEVQNNWAEVQNDLAEAQADAIVEIGKHLKEKMD